MAKKSKMSNTVIRASAGSGKTFLLSNTFLNILFQSGNSIDSTLNTILASTFTRKAAGEITDRIFTKFADVALDPDKRKELGDYLCYPKLNDLENTLQTLLAELARNMYRLRIGTLDAYFNKIATAFSLELGLPPGWTMLDDTEFPRLLTEAVREVFSESKHNDAKRLMHLLQKGEEAASMVRELVGLAKIMLPLVRETHRNHWNHATPERLENHTHDLLSEEKIGELIEKIEAITDDMLPQTAEKKPHYRYVGARDKITRAMHSQDWKLLFSDGLVKAVVPILNDPSLECKYCSKDVRKDAPGLFEVVRTLLPHTKSIQIKILIGQTQATYELLKMVAEKLDDMMERERKFRFEDITRKIADYGFNNRLDSLQHRLNADTKHLLLDEFQDTSLPQWEILEPLALQTASDKGGTYFCVGDEKQSIYSWRGGEAAIFGSMKSRMEQGLHGLKIDEHTMETTRRCAKPIVKTVNELFSKIKNSSTVGKASDKAGTRWQQRFKHHDTKNENPGYCTLEESPLAEDKDKNAAHLKYVVERIKQLISVVEHRSDLKEGIGILVATRKFGAKIVSALKEAGIETTGSGASLSQSPAVQCIISALVFAEHPGNTIARFHLAHSPIVEAVGLDKHDDSYCSRRIRDELAGKGYGKVIGDYIKILADSCNAAELEHLEKLLEVAYRFDEVSMGVRTQPFIDMLEDERVSHQNAAKVQVMTIHAAKGLEFDIVVLPELDGNLKGRTSETKFVTKNKIADDSTSPVDFVLRYVNEDLQNILPDDYQKVFQYRVQREVEESLSELYVAMTRAIRSLITIVPQRKKASGSTNFENVLRELPGTQNPSSENILYETGDPNWYSGIPLTKPDAKPSEVPFDVLECKLNKKKVLHHVSRIVPSKLHTEWKAKNTARTEKPSQLPEEAALKGTLMHFCFERSVEWLDEQQSGNDDELRELIEDMLESRSATFTTDDILAEFRSACKQPEIIASLSRSRYLPDRNPVLDRERRFAVWIDGKIMRGSIDRLVVGRDPSGAITRIEILDYKTGDSTNDIDLLVETYQQQLDAYRQAVCELYGIDAELVDTTLVFVTLGKVITVPSILKKG